MRVVNLRATLTDGLYRIVKYEGVRGLSKGTIMSIIGVSNGAIQFMAYEELKKQARRRRIRKYGKTDGPVDLVSLFLDDTFSPVICNKADSRACVRATPNTSLHLAWQKALRLL